MSLQEMLVIYPNMKVFSPTYLELLLRGGLLAEIPEMVYYIFNPRQDFSLIPHSTSLKARYKGVDVDMKHTTGTISIFDQMAENAEDKNK